MAVDDERTAKVDKNAEHIERMNAKIVRKSTQATRVQNKQHSLKAMPFQSKRLCFPRTISHNMIRY